MNTSNITGSGTGHPFAIVASIVLGALLATTSFAHTPAEEGFSGYESNPQVSASAARRLARSYLCSVGFCSSFGPGGAKVRSITRDSATWVINVQLSNGPTSMNQKHVLYVDAQTGAVSETRKEQTPEQVAGK